MGRIRNTCHHAWLCCPSWTRVLLLFAAGNLIGDILSFPFAHTFWNLLEFEGWFHPEETHE